MREQVSLLRGQGHPDAYRYPVARVWEEVSMVVKRQNLMLASGVGLLQMAVSAMLDKEAAKQLKATLEGLTHE
ncbi:hypothetical protein [Billgrantia desiderata]|uniref:hypothetical protein n=1 Tax=Billgrantia desiderata TaxID=52021 RepID=UPI001F3E4D87|nr:hypothetical protein [Halomonas desiderata]MCE8012894.1 hypothetical protein [Halomonas desiderata]